MAITDRKNTITYLKNKAFVELIERDTAENSDEDYEEDNKTLMQLTCVGENRFFKAKTTVPKIDFNLKYNLIRSLDDDRVRQEIRMSWASFDILYSMLASNDMYTRHVTRRRVSVQVQMFVALERLGTYGNGTSVGRMARAYGISGKLRILKIYL